MEEPLACTARKRRPNRWTNNCVHCWADGVSSLETVNRTSANIAASVRPIQATSLKGQGRAHGEVGRSRGDGGPRRSGADFFRCTHSRQSHLGIACGGRPHRCSPATNSRCGLLGVAKHAYVRSRSRFDVFGLADETREVQCQSAVAPCSHSLSC